MKFAFNAIAMALSAVAVSPGLSIASQPPQSVPYTVTNLTTGKLADVEVERKPQTSKEAAVISQKDKMFTPAMVTIRAYRFIVIHNDDDTVHHAYCASSGLKYNSGPMEIGSSVSIMFRDPGTYEVRCAIHPQMLLTVHVEELAKQTQAESTAPESAPAK